MYSTHQIFTPFPALSWSAQAAVTKHYRPDGLNNTHLFLMVLEVVKPKIKVLADLVLGVGFPSGLQTATAHCICTWRRDKCLYKGTDPIMTSSKPTYLPNAPAPHLITLSHWGEGLQHTNLGEA